MRILKTIVITLAVLLGLFIGIGFLLPQKVAVERSTTIAADPATVFEYVNDLEKFHAWSPWADLDPNMRVEFSGPETGVGASMSWSSDVPEVGSGEQKIIMSEQGKRVVTALIFDGESAGEAEFELAPQAAGTHIAWRFRMDFGANPVARYFGLMIEDMLGDYYETGLRNLKSQVEAQPQVAIEGAQPQVAPEGAQPQVATEEVVYTVGDTSLKGFFAFPRNAERAPGVLVVHEWWGHTDYARRRATMLAELGYVAFALDMYGDGKVTSHPKEANAFMMEVVNNAEVAQARFNKALEMLKNHPAVSSSKIAAIGYCFGGAVSLSMARSGADLAGVVSFHGALEGLAPINREAVKARFLVLNGAADPFVSAAAKDTFKAEMDAAQLKYEFIDYPGAVHAFTNSEADAIGEAYGLPLKYDAAADQDSWRRMQAFFREIFAL